MTCCKRKKNCTLYIICFVMVLFTVGCSRKKEAPKDYPDLEADIFLDKINQTVELADNETIEMEKTGWIEQDICYRVAVQRVENVEGEYGHLRDYIYVLDDEVKFVVIDYPSKKSSFDDDRYVYDACNFDVSLVDVNFDGNRDIIISLGNVTTAGISLSCAYIYNGKDYVYTKSFEEIPNYSVNNEEQCIWGRDKNKIYKYKFENGEFVLSGEISSATLSYFENVDKNYKLEDIEKEIGKHNRTEGFGAIYYVWKLDDGSEAWVYFSGGYGEICRIHIIRNETEQILLYNRWEETEETESTGTSDNQQIELEVVNMACDRMYFNSLSEVENDATIIVEAVAKDVLGQEVSTHYDYEFQKELPGSGYTKREIEISKVYKGDVNVGDKIVFLQDYYIWENADGTQQLISITSLKPVEEGERYLLFLKYETNKDAYIAVCDYQGLYPVDIMSEHINGATEFTYIYQTQDLSNLMPIYDEVMQKYFD